MRASGYGVVGVTIELRVRRDVEGAVVRRADIGLGVVRNADDWD